MALHDRDSQSPSGTRVSSTPLNSLLESFIQKAQEMLNSDVLSSADLAYSPNASAPLSNASVSDDQATLARSIDHTLLKPEATPQDVEKVCHEALTHGFATVCLNSSYISLATKLLHGSSVKPIAVVGFPLGACTTDTKVFETQSAIRLGALEIDMVIHLGALRSANYKYVLDDIQQVVRAAAPLPVKVILETSTLTLEQKIAGCALAKAAGAAFVKTSTGFSTGGATVEDIALMRKLVGPEMGVKASGGIRTQEDLLKMLQAGANRIGASASVAIVSSKKTSSQASGGSAAY